jgi:hypothetical protein
MATAAVVYRSRTGKTRRFADEIGGFLAAHGIESRVMSIGECDAAALANLDYLFLGCWTNGWLIVRQHPDGLWMDFARRLPRVDAPRVALFTTYALATGGMFDRMRAHLAGKTAPITLELKSRDGLLSDADRRRLEGFIAG